MPFGKFQFESVYFGNVVRPVVEFEIYSANSYVTVRFYRFEQTLKDESLVVYWGPTKDKACTAL